MFPALPSHWEVEKYMEQLYRCLLFLARGILEERGVEWGAKAVSSDFKLHLGGKKKLLDLEPKDSRERGRREGGGERNARPY